MENFIVSARKYRPQRFEEVVGQSSITRTLQNAIANDHLAQALLFCGPRGVGKTTCARILAKAINLEDSNVSLTGGDDDFSFNIFELDAASNNSVDDIRSLIDQVRFAPQKGKYKVYIIDEVHMLSQAAFNAFLKTLEEPPAHAIFILATTEKHKIIPTILSRCQIFDFKRIQIEDIVSHLKNVAEQENINVENDALHVIAQKADGAMRDALSIFDRVVSFSGDTITYKDVIDNLNVLDYDYYFRLVDHFLECDVRSSLTLFDEILKNGFDAHLFINGLAEHFRNLMVCKDPATLPLLEVGDKNKEMYGTQAGKTPLEWLFHALEICQDADVKFKTSNNQRLLVEFALMRLCGLGSESEMAKKKTSITAPPSQSVITQPSSGNAENQKPIETKTVPEEIKPNAESQKTENPVVESPTSAPETVTETPSKPKEQETQQETPEVKTPSEPIASQPKSKLQRRSRFSIGGELNRMKQEEEEAEKKRRAADPKDDFTLEQFNEAWNDALDHLDQLNRFNLYNSLKSEGATLDGLTIKAFVHNNTQRVDFDSIRVDFMDIIRKKLNNFFVDIDLAVKPASEEDENKFAVTPQEKIKLMADKNPAVLELIKKLELDF